MPPRKPVATVAAAPSLFGNEEAIPQNNKGVTRTVYHEDKPSTRKRYDIANLGINSDYEKYGEIKVLKNKMP